MISMIMALPSPPLPKRPDAVENFLYFHSDLKNLNEVHELMVKYIGKDGAYLIRRSFSKQNCLTVSVMHERGIKHFNLAKTNNEYYVQDVKFNNLEELVNYYRNNDVPNQEGVRHVRLVYGIKRTAPTKFPDCILPSPVIPHDDSDSKGSLQRNGSVSSTSSTTSRNSLPVIIPCNQRPRPRQSILQKLFKRNSKKNSTSSLTGEVNGNNYTPTKLRTSSESELLVRQRPPMPLPDGEQPQEPVYNKDLYSRAVTENVSKLEQLQLALKQQESEERCECGLTFEESELPLEWSMHISHEPATYGRLFYMGPDKKTAWNLPNEVVVELSVDQQDNIKDVLKRCMSLLHSGSSAASSMNQLDSLSSSAASTPTLTLNTFSESAASSEFDAAEPNKQPTQHNEQTGSTGSTVRFCPMPDGSSM